MRHIIFPPSNNSDMHLKETAFLFDEYRQACLQIIFSSLKIYHHIKTSPFRHAQLRSFIASQETVARFTPLRRMAGSLVRYVFMAGKRHLFWGLILVWAGVGQCIRV